MRRGGRPSRAAVPVVGLALLAGCARPVTVSSELPACTVGDEAVAGNGVILMAQSVPTASWVPCLDTVPLGWHFSGLDARSDSARFWLDSDRDGPHAIEVQLADGCDTEGATEIPSDRDGMTRLERVGQVFPHYVGRRYYVFDGGCITVVFTLSGQYRGEPLAVATQGIGVVSRAQLADQVREQSGDRLDLDPRADADGSP